MSRSEDAQTAIRYMIKYQLKMATTKIDAARARIQQSQANVAVDREIIEAQEVLILGWQRILDAQETTP